MLCFVLVCCLSATDCDHKIIQRKDGIQGQMILRTDENRGQLTEETAGTPAGKATERIS